MLAVDIGGDTPERNKKIIEIAAGQDFAVWGVVRWIVKQV